MMLVELLHVREVAWTEGDVIRKLRSAADLTLDELGELAGLHTSVIHDLEVGRTKEPKRITMQKLATAFGVSVRDIEDMIPQRPVRLGIGTGKAGTVALQQRRAKGGTGG